MLTPLLHCNRYYVDKVCGWILELSGGKGIPFEV